MRRKPGYHPCGPRLSGPGCGYDGRMGGGASAKVPAIGVDELRGRMQVEPQFVLVDVREPWEFEAGHVPGARLIPLGDLEARMAEIPRDRPILFICQGGQRSLAAAAFLLHEGYQDVTNVDGGTAAWMERSYPVER